MSFWARVSCFTTLSCRRLSSELSANGNPLCRTEHLSQVRMGPDGAVAPKPTGRDKAQSKMMSRGRGRHASSLVPGNGRAPATAVAKRAVDGGSSAAARRARRHAWAHSLDAAHLQPSFQVSRVRAHRTGRRSPRQCSRHDIGTDSLLAWPRENRDRRWRRPGRPTERRRDLIGTATPRRRNPRDSQGARTPMNGESRTDSI